MNSPFVVKLSGPIFSFCLIAVVSLLLPALSANCAEIDHTLAVEPQKIPALEERENLKILYYKPIYFIFGNPQTKVQLSFRAPLSDEIPLNFAYSQIIFWELTADSKPFLDATYNPEFFYRVKIKKSAIQSVDLGIWEHNSNGKGGGTSRSYDQSFVRFNCAFEGARWITKLNVKFRYVYDPDVTTVDINRYVSPLDVGVRFLQLFDSWFDESELSLAIKPGGAFVNHWETGGYEVGANFRFGGLHIIPAFYLQYYHGYAETLLNYNQLVDVFRAGVMF